MMVPSKQKQKITFKCRTDPFPKGQAATAVKLAQGQLHVE